MKQPQDRRQGNEGQEMGRNNEGNKAPNLYLLFFADHKDAQFVSAEEIQIKMMVAELKTMGAGYIPLQLCGN